MLTLTDHDGLIIDGSHDTVTGFNYAIITLGWRLIDQWAQAHSDQPRSVTIRASAASLFGEGQLAAARHGVSDHDSQASESLNEIADDIVTILNDVEDASVGYVWHVSESMLFRSSPESDWLTN